MESYTIIVLIFGIIIFILLFFLYFINKILQYKIRIDNSFVAIKENLNDKELIIDNILNFLEKNLEYEKSLIKKISTVKELATKVKNNKEGIENFHKIESELETFVILENTYKKLSKNKEYINIKNEIINNRDKLIYATDSYDKGVIDYNNYRNNKLIYILSKLLGMPEYDCYNK